MSDPNTVELSPSTPTPYPPPKAGQIPKAAQIRKLWQGITGKRLRKSYAEGFRWYCTTEDRRLALAIALMRSTGYTFTSEPLRAAFVAEECNAYADADLFDLYFEAHNQPTERAREFLKTHPNATFREMARFLEV